VYPSLSLDGTLHTSTSPNSCGQSSRPATRQINHKPPRVGCVPHQRKSRAQTHRLALACAPGTSSAAYPDAQLAALAKLVATLCHTFGIPIDALPADQRSERLDSGTATAFKGIAAHVNFRTDKWDEGPWFPWDAFLTSVRARSGEVTTPAHDAPSARSPDGSGGRWRHRHGRRRAVVRAVS
jgi:hypothetical protein